MAPGHLCSVQALQHAFRDCEADFLKWRALVPQAKLAHRMRRHSMTCRPSKTAARLEVGTGVSSWQPAPLSFETDLGYPL